MWPLQSAVILSHFLCRTTCDTRGLQNSVSVPSEERQDMSLVISLLILEKDWHRPIKSRKEKSWRKFFDTMTSFCNPFESHEETLSEQSIFCACSFSCEVWGYFSFWALFLRTTFLWIMFEFTVGLTNVSWELPDCGWNDDHDHWWLLFHYARELLYCTPWLWL